MIYQEITNDYHFWEWLKKSDSYSTKFSLEGAKAVQEYYNEMGETLESAAEFDPVAWCCEFSEYDSVAEAYAEHYGDDSDLPEEQRRTTKEQQLEYFTDNTTVLELENGHIVLGEF